MAYFERYYVPEYQVQPSQMNTSPIQNYQSARDEAKLYNPVQLSREAYRAQQARNSGGPTINTKELEKTYPQYRVDWSKFETGRGQVPKDLADMIIKRQRENEAASQLSSTNFSSISQGAASVAGSLVGSIYDPINLLTGLLVPESAAVKLLPKSLQLAEGIGAGITKRFAGGAISNAVVNGLAITPEVAALRSSLGDNPTALELAGDVAIGGLIGGAFSAVGGVVSDAIGRRNIMKATAESPAGKIMDIDKATHITPEEKLQMAQAAAQDPIDLTEQEIKLTNTNTQSQSALLAKSIADTYDNKPIYLDQVFEEVGDEFNLSSIKRMQREFSAEAYRLYDKVDNIQELNKDLMSKASIEKIGDGYTASTKLGDVEVRSGLFNSKRKAIRDLRTILKEYTETNRAVVTRLESGNYSASYVTDTGSMKNIRGIGSTPSKAVADLNNIYNDNISNPRAFADKASALRERVDMIEGDIQRAKAFLNNDRAATAKLPEYTSEVEPTLSGASKAYKNALRELRSLEGRTVRPKDLDKHNARLAIAQGEVQQARSNLEHFINTAVKENEVSQNKAQIGDNVKVNQPKAVEAENNFIDSVNRITEKENPILVERRVNSEQTVAQNETYTKSYADLNKYADELEAEIRDSNAYYLLDNEMRNTIDDNFESIRNDVDIMQSEEFRDIVRNYIACERGLK